MKLHEYQSKLIFARYGVPIPKGRVAATADEAKQIAEELGGRVVIKSQVLVGGRGKAGGVKVAKNSKEAAEFAQQVLAQFRFDQDPAMDLPTANVAALVFPADEASILREWDGQGRVLVSPMQLALAFSSIAAGGMAPAPRLVYRLETEAGWITPATASHPVAMIPAVTAARLRELLVSGDGTAEWTGCGLNTGGISWYAGFETAGDDPVVVVVALEGKPSDAAAIGRMILAFTAATEK